MAGKRYTFPMSPASVQAAPAQGELTERQVLETIEKYLRYSKKKRKNEMRSPATADVYLGIVRHLINEYGVLVPNDDLAIKVQQDKYARRNNDSTVRQTMFAIDYWAEALGAPVIEVAKPHVAQPELDPSKKVTLAEAQHLIDSPRLDLRDKTIITLMLATGVRREHGDRAVRQEVGQESARSEERHGEGRGQGA